jgi:antitoxin component YwqK of YwqJK toxin-antitoxin module
MSKNINNITIQIFCNVMVACMILSCKQQEEKKEGKLIFEKPSNINTKVMGSIVNGKKEGLWISYTDSGKVSSFEIYINDSLTGETIGYFDDGIISSHGTLKNGKREGEWIQYYSKDRIAEKGRYYHGNKIGVWEYYIEEGKLDKKIEYLNDGTKKIVEDNHLLPPTPASMKPSPIKDSNNNAVIK